MDRTATISEIYVFAEPTWAKLDLSGFHVEGVDGEIGTIDDTTYEIGSDALVVNTGPWIFGKKVMLPAGVIESVDHDAEKVMVGRSKDEIKNAPEFEDTMLEDEGYRTRLGSYYDESSR